MKKETGIMAIVAVALIVISWPAYRRFECRSRQSEAQMGLIFLHSAERLFYVQHQQYASLKTLKVKNGFRPKYYRFEMVRSSDQKWQIEAISGTDKWWITERGVLKHQGKTCSL